MSPLRQWWIRTVKTYTTMMTAITRGSVGTSARRPRTILSMGQTISPSAIPSAKEKKTGVDRITRNAGTASVYHKRPRPARWRLSLVWRPLPGAFLILTAPPVVLVESSSELGRMAAKSSSIPEFTICRRTAVSHPHTRWSSNGNRPPDRFSTQKRQNTHNTLIVKWATACPDVNPLLPVAPPPCGIASYVNFATLASTED